jgi:hypothetical protein
MKNTRTLVSGVHTFQGASEQSLTKTKKPEVIDESHLCSEIKSRASIRRPPSHFTPVMILLLALVSCLEAEGVPEASWSVVPTRRSPSVRTSPRVEQDRVREASSVVVAACRPLSGYPSPPSEEDRVREASPAVVATRRQLSVRTSPRVEQDRVREGSSAVVATRRQLLLLVVS